jgi:pimeloyl-ACP methyl ester carboxylesterase
MIIKLNKAVLALGLLAMLQLAAAAQSPQDVSFATADGGMIDADLYGQGTQGVVFAHGAVFNKQSWAPLAKRIASLGYRALAIDFRGYGNSKSGNDAYGLDQDVLAAVHWLHAQGVKSVSVVGGSMGGGAAARAATEVERGQIDKLILLSPVPIEHPEQLKAGSILYIASRDESLAAEIRQQYAEAPQPKQLVLLDGSAHAQNIFATTQAQHLSDVIVHFLTGQE